VTTAKGDELMAEVRSVAEAKNFKKEEKIIPGYNYYDGWYCSEFFIDLFDTASTLEEATTKCDKNPDCGCFFLWNSTFMGSWVNSCGPYYLNEGTQTRPFSGLHAWVKIYEDDS